jgi:uncharacterized protein (TIGR03083 family)
METEQYIDQLTRNSDRIAACATTVGTDAAVPTCPGWTVRDLLLHLVGGDVWAREIVEEGMRGNVTRVEREERTDPADGDALILEFRTGAQALVDTLAAADPTTPVWTFSAADRTANFWQRRRAQETAVHRYDVESAASTTTPIDAALAVDGVDEFLRNFLPRLRDPLAAVGDASVHLHSTDTDGEWLIRQRDGEVVVTDEHAKGDVAVRGTASDLLLFLWGRIPADALEVFGDAALLARVSEAIRV